MISGSRKFHIYVCIYLFNVVAIYLSIYLYIYIHTYVFLCMYVGMHRGFPRKSAALPSTVRGGEGALPPRGLLFLRRQGGF